MDNTLEQHRQEENIIHITNMRKEAGPLNRSQRRAAEQGKKKITTMKVHWRKVKKRKV